MAIVAHKVQSAKEQAIKDLKTKFSSVSDYVFADYRGLTVDQITDLRSKLREKECEFKVVKNNFARIAFQEMEVADVEFDKDSKIHNMAAHITIGYKF